LEKGKKKVSMKKRSRVGPAPDLETEKKELAGQGNSRGQYQWVDRDGEGALGWRVSTRNVTRENKRRDTYGQGKTMGRKKGTTPSREFKYVWEGHLVGNVEEG